jgi:hypothetical protein
MKITTKNYFSVIAKYEEDLPEGLDWSRAYLLNETNNGKNWRRYKTDKEFKRVADLSFQKTGRIHRCKGQQAYSRTQKSN